MKLTKEVKVGIVSAIAIGLFIYGFNFLKGKNLFSSQRKFYAFYNNIDGNLSGTFTLVDSSYESIYEPARVSISRFDIDNDTNADLVTGNFAGGVRFYTHYNAAGINTNNENPENLFTLFPNPAGDYIHLLLKKVLTTKSIDVSIIDVMGRNLCTFRSTYGKHYYKFLPQWW